MRTYLDCIPCFFQQALEAARMSGADRETQRQVLNDVAGVLPEFSLTASPPEMGQIIYDIVKRNTGQTDPYAEIKARSNRLAMGIYDQIAEKVEQSADRLLTAVELAIAGNIIDFGIKKSLDVNEELDKILSSEQQTLKNEDERFFQYIDFKKALKDAATILYLADNAGETVFDRILLAEIKRMDPEKELLYAVKAKPIINDALEKDARDCGIDGLARVISSGSDAPGTILSRCSADFLETYREADMVISKGQGNFEALSESDRALFFLFIAKCPVIARDVGCQVGNVILRRHRGEK